MRWVFPCFWFYRELFCEINDLCRSEVSTTAMMGKWCKKKHIEASQLRSLFPNTRQSEIRYFMPRKALINIFFRSASSRLADWPTRSLGATSAGKRKKKQIIESAKPTNLFLTQFVRQQIYVDASLSFFLSCNDLISLSRFGQSAKTDPLKGDH